jgi:hypothetical protein
MDQFCSFEAGTIASLFMDFCIPASSIIQIKVGEAVFSFNKEHLIGASGVFQHCYDLFSDGEYELETQVSPEVFQAFMDCVCDASLPISTENCKSFWFLADEFGIDRISKRCDLIMESQPQVLPEVKLPARPSVRREVEVGPGHRVILKMGDDTETYVALCSPQEIESFVFGLKITEEKNIEIEGIDGRDRPVEKAVAAVYANVVATFPENRLKRQNLAMILWKLQRRLSQLSIGSMIYCLNRLNEIAPTTFEKAQLLLLSQCNPLYPDKFIQLPNADEIMIRDAVRMLQHEKNGRKDDADQLLSGLKNTGRYEALFENEAESD